jgi:uncharacterized protein YPO0396
MQQVEETQNSMAHSEKIKNTQTQLEKKINELKREEDHARKENTVLVQQIKQKDSQILTF